MLCKTWSDDINLLTGQPVLLAKSQIIASESFKRCELGPRACFGGGPPCQFIFDDSQCFIDQIYCFGFIWCFPAKGALCVGQGFAASVASGMLLRAL